MAGVSAGRRGPWEGPLRSALELRWELLVEGFVGALEVIDPTTVIEPALLGGEGRPGPMRRKDGALLQGPVHAFMRAILVRLSELDALGEDPQRDPPDGELGEAGDRGRSEGVSAVATDPTGKPEGLEEIPETAHGGLKIKAEHAPAREEETGVTVLSSERIAQLPVAGSKLTLEVRGPGGVLPR